MTESLIDEYLLYREETRRVRPPNTLYATDLTHPCPQHIWLRASCDLQHPVETLRIFDAGRILEDRWIEILEGRKDIAVLGTQLPAYHYFDLDGEEWEIHGRVDALCQHDRNGLIIHEVKTARTTHWMKEPKEDHIAQIQLYLNALGVERGQVDYLDKTAWLTGDHPIDKSFPVKTNPNTLHRLLAEAKYHARCLRDNTVPPPNPGAWNGRVCDYCIYSGLCNKEA